MASAAPSANIIQVKGSAIFSRLTWVKEMYGLMGLRDLTADLSAAGRNLARGDVDPTAWYNLPLFIELCTAIDRRWGNGDLSLNKELARWGCHRNVPKLYKKFVKLGSVEWRMGLAPKFWQAHFSAGSLVVRPEPGQKRAEGEILDFPQPSLALEYSVLGFAIGCVELSGGKDVRGEVLASRARGAERDLMRLSWS